MVLDCHDDGDGSEYHVTMHPVTLNNAFILQMPAAVAVCNSAASSDLRIYAGVCTVAMPCIDYGVPSKEDIESIRCVHERYLCVYAKYIQRFTTDAERRDASGNNGPRSVFRGWFP